MYNIYVYILMGKNSTHFVIVTTEGKDPIIGFFGI